MSRNGTTSLWILGLCCLTSSLMAREPDRVVDVWPGLAPGETTKEAGTPVIRKTVETHPATRIGSITHPTLWFYERPPNEKPARSY